MEDQAGQQHTVKFELLIVVLCETFITLWGFLQEMSINSHQQDEDNLWKVLPFKGTTYPIAFK